MWTPGEDHKYDVTHGGNEGSRGGGGWRRAGGGGVGGSYHPPDVLQVGQQVSMPYKLSDQTQRLLDCDTAHKAHHVSIVALSNKLHHVYLLKEISLLIACSTSCRGGGGGGVVEAV